VSRRASGGFFDGTRDCFADDRSHAAADEGVFHRADDDGPSIQLAMGVDDGVLEPGVLLRLLEARGIGFQVDELQGVGGDQVAVEDFVLIVVEELGEAGTGVDAEMLITFRADVQILFEIFLPDDLAALVALHPQSFGADFFLARSVELTGLAFEPSHKAVLSSQFPVLSKIPVRQLGTENWEPRTDF